jgi:DNA-binding response OmpR family regulator
VDARADDGVVFAESPLVLVADDDPDVLSLVSFRLRRIGCRVLVAPDGRRALEAIVDHSPDVAVLDIGMPSLDGLELCRITRGNSPNRSIGIIFLTARTGERDVARGIGAGADAYVKKPFTWNELVDPLERLLARRSATPVGDPGLSAA